ncbi:MAG: ABC transporter permease subunit, partial [Pseudomonadales bacterium]
PDISFSALWSKVWYEGYQEPVYSWQSSSAGNDFEAKFSLTPLLFGTIKAAFYAMVFAVPVAIMGALYTAYFMAPVMRRIVKPGIEIMAALPTVILGFLAGLWLAPLIEANLSAVITIILVLPVAIALLSLLWHRLPESVTRPLDGWYGAVIVPVIVIAVALAFALGPTLENAFFGGDSRNWFLEVMGLDYDQRNALVVGLAMGLAVIPTIFSIAEDAIYGVPTHLINGSLALGATRWQTLMRVVILTASPGIFSAVMIGLGRAVGETMIVLMATGNTPIMDMNLFEGMRTFAANIAVELPEAEVDSSHYRILFLTALVLFAITFVFNTAAEVVRQRLRSRYGSL